MAKVFCKKYKKELDALPFPPIPGEKGMNIMQNFSKEAWDAWVDTRNAWVRMRFSSEEKARLGRLLDELAS